MVFAKLGFFNLFGFDGLQNGALKCFHVTGFDLLSIFYSFLTEEKES